MWTAEKIPSSKISVVRERHNCADMFAVGREEQQENASVDKRVVL